MPPLHNYFTDGSLSHLRYQLMKPSLFILFGIFDIYRSGYNRGYKDGFSNNRRKAIWELFLTSFLLILPFTNSKSYIDGYHQGYNDGNIAAKLRRLF